MKNKKDSNKKLPHKVIKPTDNRNKVNVKHKAITGRLENR